MIRGLELYGYVGIGVFVFLMLWRLAKYILGKSFFPDVSEAQDGLPFRLTNATVVMLLLGSCIIAWPAVVMTFISAKEEP